VVVCLLLTKYTFIVWTMLRTALLPSSSYLLHEMGFAEAPPEKPAADAVPLV
jgi:hypothetical protein